MWSLEKLSNNNKVGYVKLDESCSICICLTLFVRKTFCEIHSLFLTIRYRPTKKHKEKE